jgi:hypothetical protein
MKIISLLVICLFVAGCSDKETQARLAAIEAQNKELQAEISSTLTEIKKSSSIGDEVIRQQLTSIETVEMLQRAERYRMFNTPSGAEGLSWAFLYDTQTGRVWRYYRNLSPDGKGLKDEGYMLLIDPSDNTTGVAQPSGKSPDKFDANHAMPVLEITPAKKSP